MRECTASEENGTKKGDRRPAERALQEIILANFRLIDQHADEKRF